MRLFKYVLALIVLILTSCNISGSSISQSSSASTTSSISSSVAQSSSGQLDGIVISTSSSVNQFLGLTQRVLINATLSGNSNDNQLEWYVDNIKSISQTGLVFEFLPNEVKTYQINARKGTIVSNTISLSVSLPTFNVTNLNTISSDTIEVTAEPGLTFSINGLVISSNSSYNISTQKYTLKLSTPMTNGVTYTLRINRQGFSELVRTFVFENRKLEVGVINYQGAKVIASSENIYNIEKPFDGESSLSISMAHTSLEGTSVPVSIVVRNPNNLIDPLKTNQFTTTVLKSTNVNFNLTFSDTDLTGLWNIEIKVGSFTRTIRLTVTTAVPKVAIKSVVVYDLADTNVSGDYVPLTAPFTKVEDEYPFDVVEANVAGQYIVNKPYNGGAYELTFEIEAKNFAVPEIYSGIGVDPHVLSFGIADGKAIRYDSNAGFNLPQDQEEFDKNLAAYRITQYIDSTTLAGTYTFVFTARLNFNFSSSTSVNYSVTIIIRDVTPKIEFEIDYNSKELEANNDQSFTLFKPLPGSGLTDGEMVSSIKAILSNYESPIQFLGQPGVSQKLVSDSEEASKSRYLVDFTISYSGPVSNITNLTSRAVIELGRETDSAADEIAATNAVQDEPDYPRFRSMGSDVEIDLTEYLAYVSSITTSSIPGNHIYTIKFGSVSTQLVIRVLEPTPLIITDDNSVKYGVLDVDTFVPFDSSLVVYDEELDTYFVSMNTLEESSKYLNVNVYPFGMLPSPPNYTYSFKKSSPSGNFEATTNFVSLSLTGKTGVNYDGTLNLPSTGPGSEMKNVILEADEPGEYVLDFTINNARKVIKIVLLPSPNLEVDQLLLNDTPLTNFNDAYLIVGSTAARTLNLKLKPVNITEGFTYTINQISSDASDTSTKVLIDIEEDLIDSQVTLPALPTEGLSLGQFNNQIFYIRIYDEELLVGKTVINIYAQKVE